MTVKAISKGKYRKGIIAARKSPKTHSRNSLDSCRHESGGVPNFFWILAQLMELNTREIIFAGDMRELDELRLKIGNGEEFGIEVSYFFTTENIELSRLLLELKEQVYGCPVTLATSKKFWPTLQLSSLFQKWAGDDSGATVFCEDVAKVTKEMLMVADVFEGIPKGEKRSSSASSKLPELFLLDATAVDRAENIHLFHETPLNIASLLLSYRMGGELRLVGAPTGVKMVEVGTLNKRGETSVCCQVELSRTLNFPWRKDLLSISQRNGWIENSGSSALHALSQLYLGKDRSGFRH